MLYESLVESSFINLKCVWSEFQCMIYCCTNITTTTKCRQEKLSFPNAYISARLAWYLLHWCLLSSLEQLKIHVSLLTIFSSCSLSNQHFSFMWTFCKVVEVQHAKEQTTKPKVFFCQKRQSLKCCLSAIPVLLGNVLSVLKYPNSGS